MLSHETVDVTHVWYRREAGNKTAAEVAALSNLASSTITRPLKDGKPLSIGVVVAVARGLNLNPVAALVETGYLTQEEVTGQVYLSPLPELTNKELILELARRVEHDEDGESSPKRP